MSDDSKMFKELEEMLAQFEEQKNVIYDNYVQLVALVLNGNITSKNEIEKIMDGLMDFGEDERFLSLYKKLCRYVFSYHPQMVSEHIKMFLEVFEDED